MTAQLYLKDHRNHIYFSFLLIGPVIPTIHPALLSPASLGDDHLRPDFVKLHPEIFVLQPHQNVLVVTGSRPVASV